VTEPTIATFAALDQFTRIAERRLYRILITEAEGIVASIERKEYPAAVTSLTAHSLFMAARALRNGQP